MTERPRSPPLQRIHIVQGGQEVSSNPQICLTTVLGSCVAACLWDPETGVGGMNHFLLPEAPHGAAEDRRYGVQAMELLINGLLGKGASRSRLRAKAFGAARMTNGLVDVGARNADFIRRFLRDEGLPLEAASLGGDQARRLQFWPAAGRVRQHLTPKTVVPLEAAAYAPALPGAGEVELF